MNRYVFNTHYSTLYTDPKIVEVHKRLYQYSVSVEPPQLLDDIYIWGKAWLSNDKQHAETSQIMSIPPSPTNSANNNSAATTDHEDQVNDADANTDDSMEQCFKNNEKQKYRKTYMIVYELTSKAGKDLQTILHFLKLAKRTARI